MPPKVPAITRRYRPCPSGSSSARPLPTSRACSFNTPARLPTSRLPGAAKQKKHARTHARMHACMHARTHARTGGRVGAHTNTHADSYSCITIHTRVSRFIFVYHEGPWCTLRRVYVSACVCLYACMLRMSTDTLTMHLTCLSRCTPLCLITHHDPVRTHYASRRVMVYNAARLKENGQPFVAQVLPDVAAIIIAVVYPRNSQRKTASPSLLLVLKFPQ